MEYLTLDQKKKSLNIRVNDVKLDGSLSINAQQNQGVSTFSQYSYSSLASAVFAAQSIPLTVLITQVGKKITVDVPGFEMISTNSSSSFVEVSIPTLVKPLYIVREFLSYKKATNYTVLNAGLKGIGGGSTATDIFYSLGTGDALNPGGASNIPLEFGQVSVSWILP